MTREEFEATVWAVAGRDLSQKQMRLVLEAADAYSAGDCEYLQTARRRLMAAEAAEADGRALGRPRGRGAA